MYCLKPCVLPIDNTISSNSIKSPPYVMAASPGKVHIPTKKDHETFVYPKRKSRIPFTRSRNKSYQQAATAGMTEEGKAVSDFIAKESFEKISHDDKLLTIITSLNKIHTKLDNVHTDLYKDKDGLWCRLESNEDQVVTTQSDQEVMRFEMSVMKGVIQRQEKQIESLVDRVNDLTARQMAANITISGLIEEADENPEDVVKTFIRDKIGISVEESEIHVAHRVGGSNAYNERLMVVRCVPKLKARVLENSKNLAKKRNGNNRKFFVNAQIPESALAIKKEIAHNIRSVRDRNKNKNEEDKEEYKVRGNVLFVNDTPIVKHIQPPKFDDLLVEHTEQEKMEKMKYWFSEPVQEKGNVFTAVAAKISGYPEVNRAYRRLRQLYPAATHISMAYECQKTFGNSDDGENCAGLVIQKLLQNNNASNKAVFVIRNASQNKLGPRRFKIIEDVVTEVLAKVK